MSRFSAPIAEQIWDMKYRLKTADDEPIDACVEESWRRVAKDLARVERSPVFGRKNSTLLWKILNFCPPGGLPLAPGRSAKSRCSIAL